MIALAVAALMLLTPAPDLEPVPPTPATVAEFGAGGFGGFGGFGAPPTPGGIEE